MKSLPDIVEIKEIHLPEVGQSVLKNGTPLYYLHDDEARYVKFEVIFIAGRHQESHKMTSKACALMVKEGTGNKSSKDVAEFFDSKGSSLLIRNSLDHSFVSFVCLHEYAHDLICLARDICFKPSFKESDFKKLVRRQKQKISNEISKGEVVAYREMTSLIYGEDAPYGYNSTALLYDNLDLENVRAYHNQHWLNGSFYILLTGNITDDLMQTVEGGFGSHGSFHNGWTKADLIYPKLPSLKNLHLKDSVQSSIRCFKPLFGRSHDDYGKFFLLNTILGGYFGSRLMKNIREKEGLTYGIYSGLDPMLHSGYFYISTETQHRNADVVLDLIKKELEILSNQCINSQELLTVKRYISGQFLRMMDGPLNVMKVYRTLVLDGLPTSFYSQMLEDIWKVDAETLMSISQLYLNPDDLTTLIVGKD